MEKKQSARIPWAVVLIILAFSCALAYGGALLGTRLFGSNTFGSYRTVEITNMQSLQTTSSGFVYYDGSTVSSISSSGGVDWSYMVGADADFDTTDYGVAAWTGSTITLIDLKTGSTTYNGSMSGDVLSACIGERYTAILIGPENDSTIVLMENGGKQVNNIALDHVSAIDYGFFPNGSLLWVMVCDSNGTVPTCAIQTYKPGKEIVGSITDTEQLMYAVMFQSSQVCVAGDTYLKVYDYTGTEDRNKRRLIYGWYLAESDENVNDPLMAYVSDAQYDGASDIQDVRMMRSNLDQTVRMPYGCMDIVAEGDAVYGFATDGHIMIARAGQHKVEAYQLGIQIDQVYGVTTDGVAVVSYGQNVYLVDLNLD